MNRIWHNRGIDTERAITCVVAALVIAIASLLLTACTSGTLSNLRDVRVSEVTLAEPQIAEKKLVERVSKLRADPSKQQELAGALAELSLVHREMDKYLEPNEEANEAAHLIDPTDRSSHAYFLVCRARSLLLNAKGQRGRRILEPLLAGNWSDLDKAQIYNDLAQMCCNSGDGNLAKDYAVKGLLLRVQAAGPHSLEVAESLLTLANLSLSPDAPLDKGLCARLQLPAAATSTGDSAEDCNNRSAAFVTRAAQIQEDILGDESLQLADTLNGLGERGQLRAAAIFEKRLGAGSNSLCMTYSRLALDTKDPLMASEYARKASIASGLRQAKDDPFQKAFVYLKGALPKSQRQDRQDLLTRACKSVGINPPELNDPISEYDSKGFTLDLKKLSVPEFDRLDACTWTSFESDLTRDQFFLSGFKKDRQDFRMYLPAWGGYNAKVEVVGKGRLRFRQEGEKGQGYQEINYKWNGKTFVLVDGKPGDKDRAAVKSAIDDAANGLGYYGIFGHHAVDHDLIAAALSQSNASAQKLFKRGDARDAADRLKTMFELTSDLVKESSIGVSIATGGVDANDDAPKWIQAWTLREPQCTVNLTEQEWLPYLNYYTYFCQEAGQGDRARNVLEAVLRQLPDRPDSVLNLADAEYALEHFAKARVLYQKYLAIAKAQQIRNISQTAIERAMASTRLE